MSTPHPFDEATVINKLLEISEDLKALSAASGHLKDDVLPTHELSAWISRNLEDKADQLITNVEKVQEIFDSLYAERERLLEREDQALS